METEENQLRFAFIVSGLDLRYHGVADISIEKYNEIIRILNGK